MPDPNKLKVLEDLGYVVQGCCGICINGRFVPGANYGSCKVFTYEHAKHGKKQLSVHVSGQCSSDFKVNKKKMDDLTYSGFDRFCDELDFAEKLPEDDA